MTDTATAAPAEPLGFSFVAGQWVAYSDPAGIRAHADAIMAQGVRGHAVAPMLAAANGAIVLSEVFPGVEVPPAPPSSRPAEIPGGRPTTFP
jgi:hypothetical protein